MLSILMILGLAILPVKSTMVFIRAMAIVGQHSMARRRQRMKLRLPEVKSSKPVPAKSGTIAIQYNVISLLQ